MSLVPVSGIPWYSSPSVGVLLPAPHSGLPQIVKSRFAFGVWDCVIGYRRVVNRVARAPGYLRMSWPVRRPVKPNAVHRQIQAQASDLGRWDGLLANGRICEPI